MTVVKAVKVSSVDVMGRAQLINKSTTVNKSTTSTQQPTTNTTINNSLPTSYYKCGVAAGQQCVKGWCCSQHDYCGKTPEYCDNGCQSEFGQCDATGISTTIIKSNPLPTSYNKCGAAAGQQCAEGWCCSQYGYCGKTPEYCGSGC